MVIEFYESRALDLLADPRCDTGDGKRLQWWYFLIFNEQARLAADSFAMLHTATSAEMFRKSHHTFDAWRLSFIVPLVEYLRGAHGEPPTLRVAAAPTYQEWNHHHHRYEHWTDKTLEPLPPGESVTVDFTDGELKIPT